MADNPDDNDLLKDLMESMGDAPQNGSSPQAPKEESTAASPSIKVSLEGNSVTLKDKIRQALKRQWPLLFMVTTIFAALYIWLYFPATIPEEDKIHEPSWWVKRGLYYYKIAEDKGLEKNYITGDFSVYEFEGIPFDQQKQLYEEMKVIKGFHSTPNLTNASQFLTTFVADLNNLLRDPLLIQKIPEEIVRQVSSKDLKRLKDGIGKVSQPDASDSSAILSQLKNLNRELLENCFSGTPKNTLARAIAGKYFSYVYKKYPIFYANQTVLDLLRVADTFAFVLGEDFSKKEKLDFYLLVSSKNDPNVDQAVMTRDSGGAGALRFIGDVHKEGALSLEDQAHLEYMIATLYYELQDSVHAQKHLKKFLDLASERSSEGFMRRVEKDMNVYDSNRITVLHREIKPEKIYEAYFKLGSMQYDAGETEDAKENLEYFISSASLTDPERAFHANEILGDIHMSFKNYDKALAYFRKCLNSNMITHNQKNPIRYKVGLVYYYLNDYTNAMNYFKQVNGMGEYAKYDAAALFYMGKSLQRLNQLTDAVEIFERIREKAPQSDEDIGATFEIAKYYYQKELYDISYSEPIAPEYARGSRFDYSLKTLLNYPVSRFLKNEFLDVNEILSVQEHSETQSMGLLNDLANAFTKKGEYQKVIDIYTLMTTNPLAIHQMGSTRDRLYFDMAKIWAEHDMPIRAGETLEAMLEQIPDTQYYAKALWDICKYYMSKNDYARAIKPLRNFSSLYYGRPESPEADYLLGICEQKVGDFEQAIAAYNRAYGYIPPTRIKNASDETQTLRDSYYELGRKENPIDHNFFAYQAIYQKGEAYRDVGMYEEGIQHLYRTVFNDPLFRFTPHSEIWEKSLLVYADCYFKKGWLEKEDMKLKGDFLQKAKKSYQDYLERYSFRLLQGMGEEFDKMQNIRREENDVKRINIYYQLAYIDFAQGDFAKARERYTKIMKWPTDYWVSHKSEERKKQAFLMLPLTYYEEGRWAEAITAFRDAKDRYAASVEAPALGMRIAECLQRLGDYNNAKIEYDASKWALELANNSLFKDQAGGLDKEYWQELVSLKKNDLEWSQQNLNREKKVSE